MDADRCTVLIVDDEPALLHRSVNCSPIASRCGPPPTPMRPRRSCAVAPWISFSPTSVCRVAPASTCSSGCADHSPRTIRLLMTGYTELEDAVEAINRGHVYYYLVKPWRTEDLLPGSPQCRGQVPPRTQSRATARPVAGSESRPRAHTSPSGPASCKRPTVCCSNAPANCNDWP